MKICVVGIGRYWLRAVCVWRIIVARIVKKLKHTAMYSRTLTSNGRTTQNTGSRQIVLEISNPTGEPVKKLLAPSRCRTKTDKYEERLLKELKAEGKFSCDMIKNDFFTHLSHLVAFVGASPTVLESIELIVRRSDDQERQLNEPIRLITPTFGKDIVVDVMGTPILAGAKYGFRKEVVLGSNQEIEITIQPKSTIRLVLNLGMFYADHLAD